jgi:hypothetical protein
MLGSKWGFINTRNDMVISPVYDNAFYFHDGFAYVQTGPKSGFIDSKGKEVFSVKDLEIGVISNDSMVPYRENGKVGFLDMKGQKVVKAVYDNPVLPMFSEKLAAVATRKGDKLVWGYIDTKGQMVIKANFEEAYPFANGLALVKSNGKYGYILPDGNFAIQPQYDAGYDFSATYK